MDRLISRQAVINIIENSILDLEYNSENAEMCSLIKQLPSVRLQEPKTVIYNGDGYADGYMVYDMAECPNCSYEYEDGDKDWGLSFCPSCGQKLN